MGYSRICQNENYFMQQASDYQPKDETFDVLSIQTLKKNVTDRPDIEIQTNVENWQDSRNTVKNEEIKITPKHHEE